MAHLARAQELAADAVELGQAGARRAARGCATSASSSSRSRRRTRSRLAAAWSGSAARGWTRTAVAGAHSPASWMVMTSKPSRRW
jgi:hypothetical protein